MKAGRERVVRCEGRGRCEGVKGEGWCEGRGMV